jgi:hypothetical protein
MKENQVAEQQPSTPTVQQEKPSRKLAFATLILGIIAPISPPGVGAVWALSGLASVSLAPLPVIAGLPAVACVISGHMALSRIKKFPTKYAGRGMAITGLILGYLMCLVTTYLFFAIIGGYL